MVAEDGRLPSDPYKRVPPLQRPRWDGFAYIAYAEQADIERTLGQEKFEDWLVSDDHAAIAASEAALLGEGSEWWTGIDYSVINRLMPEVATQLP